MELSQEQLEEMVEGKAAKPRAVFYEKAVLNVAKSEAEGKRVYDTAVYIKLNQPGVRDNMSYLAQKTDINEYPEEYQYFLSNRQGQRSPGIEIIPNLEIAHLQELRDYGLLTIPQLAEATTVPAHLEYARGAAIVFNKALKEASHGNEEKGIEESTRETDTVSQIRGREHGSDVGRSEAERGNGVGDHRKTPERDGTGGRKHRGQGVNWGNVRIA